MSLITKYASLLYAGRATARTLKDARKWWDRRQHSGGKTARVSTVRQKTRGKLANNPHAYDAGTLAGKARRKALAKSVREKRAKMFASGKAPKRAHSGTRTKLERKPQSYPGKIALSKDMTGRQLNRRVRQYKRRKYIGELLTENKRDRKATADHIKAHRKMGVHPKFKTNTYDPLYNKALANYHRAFGKKK